MTSIILLTLPILCLIASIAYCIITLYKIGIFVIRHNDEISEKKREKKIHLGATIKKIRNWLLYLFFLNAMPLLFIVINRWILTDEMSKEEIFPDVFNYVLITYLASIMFDFSAISSKSLKLNEFFSRMIPTVGLIIMILLYGDTYLKLFEYFQLICMIIIVLLVIYVTFRFVINIKLWRKKKEEKVTIMK